jgi:CubicO group peptidase (beta-lactamase class C family)
MGCLEKDPVVIELSDRQVKILEEHIAQFPDNTQLSISLIEDKQADFFGIILNDDSLRFVENKDSVFEIGSLTKLFTSAMLANLLKNGKINLDEKIDPYLPFQVRNIDEKNDPITFRTLANHTSGLPRMPDNYAYYPESIHDAKAYSMETLQEYLESDLELISNPGEDYIYSNLGYGILGYLVTNLSNRDYERLLQKLLSRPYKLKNTTSNINKIRTLLVSGRDPNGIVIDNYDYGILSPSGGAFSNISDLTKFVQANFIDNEILSLQREETYGWGNFGVALGWHILKIGGSNCAWYFHSGGMEGYRSSVYMDARSKRAVVVLSNLSTFHPNSNDIDHLAYDLLKNEYLREENSEYCIAPFVEMAIVKGWGAQKRDSLGLIGFPRNSLHGVWTQVKSNRRITRTFFPDNKVQTNFQDDREIDVWGFYDVDEDKIEFTDIGGAACVPKGTYTFQVHNDTLRFQEILDNCDGRKVSLLNDWVRQVNNINDKATVVSQIAN